LRLYLRHIYWEFHQAGIELKFRIEEELRGVHCEIVHLGEQLELWLQMLD